MIRNESWRRARVCGHPDKGTVSVHGNLREQFGRLISAAQASFSPWRTDSLVSFSDRHFEAEKLTDITANFGGVQLLPKHLHATCLTF